MSVFLSPIDTWRKFLGRACAVPRLAMRQLVGGGESLAPGDFETTVLGRPLVPVFLSFVNNLRYLRIGIF